MTQIERAKTRTSREIELLACAIWAKEKCTTINGVNINHWLNMNPIAKAHWIRKAKIIERVVLA